MNMKRNVHLWISRIVRGAAFAVITASATAASATDLYNPFPFETGNIEAEAYHDPWDGSEWLTWRSGTTGSCRFVFLGTGQLKTNYIVHMPAGGSFGRVISTNWPTVYCGANMQPLRYGGGFLDFVGGDGADTFECLGTGDTFLWGGGGNDLLRGYRPGVQIMGGAGNDTIYSQMTSVSYYDAGDGDDWLFITRAANVSPVQARTRIFCGPGNDFFSTLQFGSTGPADCERP
jgi:hypothetical protein